ncbi:hypothetical protein IMZ48_26735, partial [Candidatus Bathyarchaeota archaeon]|nr:hypothetical protein [Candidatus Bathyarchaeota archaeon]
MDLGILYRSNPSGCPGSFVASNDADCTRRHTSLPRRQQHTPPPNPFLVQAIIDTLKLSPRYGPITHTVPAEADSFCAEAARITQDAVILTGDSDLLVYDIGSSSVVFLDDIRLSDGDTPPSCFKFSPLALEARLNLLDTGPVQGLRRFAFELIERPYATLLQLSDASRG